MGRKTKQKVEGLFVIGYLLLVICTQFKQPTTNNLISPLFQSGVKLTLQYSVFEVALCRLLLISLRKS